MAKRYYWLKLPDGFFRQKAIKKLRKIAGGDTYTIIYLKMLLVAMKQDGRLYFEGVEATFYDELEILADGGMAQKKIEEEAEKLGIKKKTLRNAKMELGIDSVKRGNQWYWMLSE